MIGPRHPFGLVERRARLGKRQRPRAVLGLRRENVDVIASALVDDPPGDFNFAVLVAAVGAE